MALTLVTLSAIKIQKLVGKEESTENRTFLPFLQWKNSLSLMSRHLGSMFWFQIDLNGNQQYQSKQPTNGIAFISLSFSSFWQ